VLLFFCVVLWYIIGFCLVVFVWFDDLVLGFLLCGFRFLFICSMGFGDLGMWELFFFYFEGWVAAGVFFFCGVV